MGDFLVGLLLEVAQYEYGVLSGWQLELVVDELAECFGEVHVGVGLDVLEPPVFKLREGSEQGVLPSFFSEEAEGFAPGDSVKICLVVVDVVVGFPPFEEDFLEDILGVFVGVDDSPDKPIEGFLVLADNCAWVWCGGHGVCLWSIERGSVGRCLKTRWEKFGELSWVGWFFVEKSSFGGCGVGWIDVESGLRKAVVVVMAVHGRGESEVRVRRCSGDWAQEAWGAGRFLEWLGVVNWWLDVWRLREREFLKRFGLTPVQFRLMLYIHMGWVRTITEASMYFAVGRSTLSELIQQLRGRGYLRVVRSEEDGRKRLLELLPAGRRVVQAYLKGFLPEDRVLLHRASEVFQDWLSWLVRGGQMPPPLRTCRFCRHAGELASDRIYCQLQGVWLGMEGLPVNCPNFEVL